MLIKEKILTQLLFIFLLLLSFSGNIQSQDNIKIEGNVSDALTGETLIGTNVLLVGTGIGGSTDLNGKFTLVKISPGSYTIRVTYIGYEQQEVQLELKAGDIIKRDFKLKPVALQGETTFVTAQAEGQKSAINQQLSAKSILNVVSSAQIQQYPDANAAESLRRLPGVAITREGGEGSQVVIRGMAPKHNAITIDGVRMASSNSSDRSTDLSMISSTMLAGIEVSKTITADQDADVLGGTVNFKIKEAKGGRKGIGIGLLAQGGYSGLSNAYYKYNNYKFVPSFEGRLFNERFGVFIEANFERRNLSSNEFGATYSNRSTDQTDYKTNSIRLHFIPRDRQRVNGAMVLDYRLPRGKISFTNFASSSTTEAEDRNELLNINSGAGSLNQHIYTLAYSKSKLSMIHNSLRFDDQFSLIHANLKLSHDYSETKSPDDWSVSFYQVPANINQFDNVANLDPRIVSDSVFSDASRTKLYQVSTTNRFTKERALTVSLDLDTPFRFSELITSVIKFGGKYRTLDRWNTAEVYGTNATFVSPSARGATQLIIDNFGIPTNDPTAIPLSFFIDENYDYGELLEGDFEMHNPMQFGLTQDLVHFCQDNVDAFASAGAREAYARNNYLSITNNYSGKEILTAGYLMITINIGSKFMILPGIRYQNLRTTYTGTRGQQTALSYFNYDHSTDTTITMNHPYWLPNINFRYKPIAWFDIRLAYSNTLSYPDFNAIIPRIDVTTGAAIAWNNYSMKPAHSRNYDVYFTFSENKVGLFTVGGFYKQIYDLIYPWTFSKAGLEAKPYYLTSKDPAAHLTYNISTYINNPYVADNYGLEIDWQTHFWYLPDPFKGLILNINYTHGYSEAKYPYVIAGATSMTNIDTSFTDRLLYQPNHIVNFTLGYDYRSFSIRGSLLYQDDVFSGVSQWPQLRSVTPVYRRWDISMKQRLPWIGMELYGNIYNLNNAKDSNVLQMYKETPRTVEIYGMKVELGLRLQL